MRALSAEADSEITMAAIKKMVYVAPLRVADVEWSVRKTTICHTNTHTKHAPAVEAAIALGRVRVAAGKL